MKRTALTTLLCAPALLFADDFQTADFSLRFPTTLSHFSPYGDVAAEAGSGTASLWGTAPNLAGLSWGLQSNPMKHPKGFDVDGIMSVQHSHLVFDQGQEIRFLSEALVFDLDESNVIRFAFVQGNSNSEIIRGYPVTFNFDLLGGRLDWGHKLSDDIRLGFGAGYSESEITFRAPLFDAIHTDRDTWGVRGGISSSFWDDNVILGLMADYGQGRNHTVEQLPSPTGQIIRTVESETIDQFYIRTGIAVALDRPNPNLSSEDRKKEVYRSSWVNLDYEFSRFSGDHEALNNHRVLLGADYMWLNAVHLRGGVFVDGRGNAGWSTGLAIHVPTKSKGDYRNSFHIDIAYQSDAFPEVEQEFGRAQTLNISIAFQWGQNK